MQVPSHCIHNGYYQANKPTVNGSDDGYRNKYSYINSENMNELYFLFYLQMFRWLHSCCWTMLQTPFPLRVSAEVESVSSALCNTDTVLCRSFACISSQSRHDQHSQLCPERQDALRIPTHPNLSQCPIDISSPQESQITSYPSYFSILCADPVPSNLGSSVPVRVVSPLMSLCTSCFPLNLVLL